MTAQEFEQLFELNWDHDRFCYEALLASEVRTRLRALAEFIGQRFVPWARSVTPRIARDQLRTLGTGRWDETIWLEDYDRYIASHPVETGIGQNGGTATPLGDSEVKEGRHR